MSNLETDNSEINTGKNPGQSRAKIYILLHLLLMVFSCTGIFSKLAATEDFLSLKWCIYYGGVIVLLGVYAIGWQQIIKRMPLTTAYANKAVTTAWGLVFGVIFFSEKITIGKVAGVVIIMAGVILYALSEDAAEEPEGDDTLSDTAADNQVSEDIVSEKKEGTA